MEAKRNPKDSMKSTWRTADRSEWTIHHRILDYLNIHHVSLDQEVPVFSKDDKVPYLPGWQFHRWILVHAFIPVAIHHLYVSYTNSNPNVLVVLAFYSLALNLIAIREIHIWRRLGHIYGFFDGDKHERDGVPDVSVKKVLQSLGIASSVRPMLAVILSYRRNEVPADINWIYLPLEVTVYALMVDLWFYWYHRLMHETDSLWQHHRTHHLTKHPNPLLSLYADEVQEVFDVVVIPLLAFGTMKLVGFPMGFYETWICYQYNIFTEVMGHSGLRVYAIAPSPLSWLYKLCGVEGVIEDHDLHHRKGWKNHSHSYGKHSGIWDSLWGTRSTRIECRKDNIDYENTASFPIF